MTRLVLVSALLLSGCTVAGTRFVAPYQAAKPSPSLRESSNGVLGGGRNAGRHAAGRRNVHRSWGRASDREVSGSVCSVHESCGIRHDAPRDAIRRDERRRCCADAPAAAERRRAFAHACSSAHTWIRARRRATSCADPNSITENRRGSASPDRRAATPVKLGLSSTLLRAPRSLSWSPLQLPRARPACARVTSCCGLTTHPFGRRTTSQRCLRRNVLARSSGWICRGQQQVTLEATLVAR